MGTKITNITKKEISSNKNVKQTFNVDFQEVDITPMIKDNKTTYVKEIKTNELVDNFKIPKKINEKVKKDIKPNKKDKDHNIKEDNKNDKKTNKKSKEDNIV